jgi:uncharacterized repeat protein (TIGR03803 family)
MKPNPILRFAVTLLACAGMLRVSTATAVTETVLYSFKGGSDGSGPNGVIRVGHSLYGTTSAGGGSGCFENVGCGTVFKLNLTSQDETILHRFNGSDGSNPAATLSSVEGSLYGTTYRGGAGTGCVLGYGCGTAFKIDPVTGALTLLHSFSVELGRFRSVLFETNICGRRG